MKKMPILGSVAAIHALLMAGMTAIARAPYQTATKSITIFLLCLIIFYPFSLLCEILVRELMRSNELKEKKKRIKPFLLTTLAVLIIIIMFELAILFMFFIIWR